MKASFVLLVMVWSTGALATRLEMRKAVEWDDSFAEADAARAASVAVQALDPSGLIPLTTSGAALYTIRVAFGSAGQEIDVVFDTGSAASWILEDTYQSSTFENAGCHDPLCSSFVHFDCDLMHNLCYIKTTYSSGQHINGEYVRDTINFAGKSTALAFGLISDNYGFGSIKGMVGFSMKSFSMLRQLGIQQFGTCLGRMDGTLYLDDSLTEVLDSLEEHDIPIMTLNIMDSEHASHYETHLLAVSIGDEECSIPPKSVFKFDTGTYRTYLVTPFYNFLRTQLDLMFATTYGISNRSQLCYKLPRNHRIPSGPDMVFHFSTGDIRVPSKRYLYPYLQGFDDEFCAAIANLTPSSSDDDEFEGYGTVGVFGNRMQQGQTIIYDVENFRMSFAQTNICP